MVVEYGYYLFTVINISKPLSLEFLPLFLAALILSVNILYIISYGGTYRDSFITAGMLTYLVTDFTRV
jgi:hypothetical protein